MATILIADDSPTQLAMLKQIVEKLGHEVITAEDGAQAVEVAEAINPDLILMDVVMPNLNGFQATRTLSRGENTSHIPIILVSTKNQETDKLWGMRQGAKAYLSKPVAPAQLKQALESFLP